MARNKVTKDSVPEGFTLPLCFVDAVPVIFFGLDCILLGRKADSVLFIIGALLCLFAGACKVLWKFIVVLKQKNIWNLFIQMRICMPIGFVMMLVSAVMKRELIASGALVRGFCSYPSVIFFVLGILGMTLMMVFAFKLDNADLKANWIEQLTNGIAQIMFFIGLILL